MCGIAGIVATGHETGALQPAVKCMTDSIRHRGPDGEGSWVRTGIALGHRRLAIIDIEGGDQPFVSASGRLILSFNGEIYNYKQLREELQELGFEFRSQGDTEVLVNAWEAWGVESLDRLQGMFAFALWDTREQRLWLGRDRTGIKPCFFSSPRPGVFTFASELKGILACPLAGDKSLRADALVDYLSLGYIPLEKTILKEVFKLLPGEVIAVGADARICFRKQYWSPQPGIDTGEADVSVDADTVWSVVAKAVHSQTVADVPVAAFLSGGIDSSTVSAAMAEMSDSQVTAYTIGIAGGGFDESEYARIVATRLGLDHRLRHVDVNDALNPEFIAGMYDEPFADSSAVPTSILCKFTAESHKVALSGDGGDECFFGYTWYRSFLRRQKIEKYLRAARLKNFLPAVHRAGVLAKKYLGRAPGLGLLEALRRDPVDGYLFSQSISPFVEPNELLSHSVREELHDYRTVELFSDKARLAEGASNGAVCRLLDFHFYLPGDILTKVDRAAMAYSLEVRVPLLDESVIDMTSAIAARDLMQNGRLKGLLLEAARPHLPAEVLERRKMGFSVPVDQWFQAELGVLFEELLFESDARTRELLDQQKLRIMLDDHVAGRACWGSLLWAILQLELSLRGLGI